jgi:hypothetical protein
VEHQLSHCMWGHEVTGHRLKEGWELSLFTEAWQCGWLTDLSQKGQATREGVRSRLSTDSSSSLNIRKWAQGEQSKSRQLAQDCPKWVPQFVFLLSLLGVVHLLACWRSCIPSSPGKIGPLATLVGPEP